MDNSFKVQAYVQCSRVCSWFTGTFTVHGYVHGSRVHSWFTGTFTGTNAIHERYTGGTIHSAL